jgi:hypothetical protein
VDALRLYTECNTGKFSDLDLDIDLKSRISRADVIFIDTIYYEARNSSKVLPHCRHCRQSMDPDVYGSICRVCNYGEYPTAREEAGQSL